jgi:hypothetical protein
VKVTKEFWLRQQHRKVLSRNIIASLRGNLRVDFTTSPATQ